MELATGEKVLSKVKIQGGIFQRYALSTLIFVKTIMTLNYILRKCTGRKRFLKNNKKRITTVYTWTTSCCL